jgi:hypothetical protein
MNNGHRVCPWANLLFLGVMPSQVVLSDSEYFFTRRIFKGALFLSLFMGGCATSTDIGKMIDANNATVVESKVSSLKTEIINTIQPKLDQSQTRNEELGHAIESLSQRLDQVEKDAASARLVLEQSLADRITGVVARQDADSRKLQEDLARIRQTMAMQSKGLEESTRSFSEKLQLEEQKIRETVKTLENFIRSSLSDWEVSARELRESMKLLKNDNVALAARVDEVSEKLVAQSKILRSTLEGQLKGLQDAIAQFEVRSSETNETPEVPSSDVEAKDIVPSSASVAEPTLNQPTAKPESSAAPKVRPVASNTSSLPAS